MLGIMGAMPEEINDLVSCLEEVECFEIGNRTYYKGKLWNKEVVIVFSRWGKVAASITVSTLILNFKITELIFTGVAGAINKNIKIGDIVIGEKFYQHDMDARPLMAQFEIPLLGKTFFESQQTEIQKAKSASESLLNNNTLPTSDLKEFNIVNPKVHIGDIASGDKFFANYEAKRNLENSLQGVLCVEMEGAAVAQVCFEFNIPFTIIRTISDTADDHAPINFSKFINTISSKYSLEIIKNILHK